MSKDRPRPDREKYRLALAQRYLACIGLHWTGLHEMSGVWRTDSFSRCCLDPNRTYLTVPVLNPIKSQTQLVISCQASANACSLPSLYGVASQKQLQKRSFKGGAGLSGRRNLEILSCALQGSSLGRVYTPRTSSC